MTDEKTPTPVEVMVSALIPEGADEAAVDVACKTAGTILEALREGGYSILATDRVLPSIPRYAEPPF